MAKFDFLPDLHHVYSKVAFFASYEQLQSALGGFNVWPLKAIFSLFTILWGFVSKLTKNLSQISHLKVHANSNHGI